MLIDGISLRQSLLHSLDYSGREMLLKDDNILLVGF